MSTHMGATPRQSNDEITVTAHNNQTEVQTTDDGKNPTRETEKYTDPDDKTEEAVVDVHPDGGWRAWSQVAGAMLNTFSTFGLVNSWGTFQAYYTRNILVSTSPSAIAWIGSLQYALMFLSGFIVGRWFDIGFFRVPFVVSALVLVVATFLVAECKVYWHFILCQGIAIGLAAGCIFCLTTLIIPQYFKLKRGLAMGCMAVGSSIGGTVFPIAVRQLIPQVGFPWTMRILGFILFFTLGTAQLLIRRRIPPSLSHQNEGMLNFNVFKQPAFTVYCLSAFFTFLGLYTVLTFIDVSATSVGVPEDFAFYLVSIANGGSGAGRLFGGVISDLLGPMNAMIPMTVIAAILTYAWPYATSKATLIVIAVLYGFSSGTYISLSYNPMMAMGDPGEIGRRVGMYNFFLGIGGLAGPPISGAINSRTGGYTATGFYAGSMVFVGIAFMTLTRHLLLRGFWGKL